MRPPERRRGSRSGSRLLAALMLTALVVPLLAAGPASGASPGPEAGDGAEGAPAGTLEQLEGRLGAIDIQIADALRRQRELEARVQGYDTRLGDVRAAMVRAQVEAHLVQAGRFLLLDGRMHRGLAQKLAAHDRLVDLRLRRRALQRPRAAVEALREGFRLQTLVARLKSERSSLQDRIREMTSLPELGPGATRDAWAHAFLAHLGAPPCQENLVALVAWQTQEGTTARFNPLATTLDMPGATIFNSVGVRNYASLDEGLEATRLTLVNGAYTYGYGWVLASLRACSAAETTAGFVNASSWCAGCTNGMYVTGLVERVRADYGYYASL